ncbi:M23 family metallopeptidase [Aminobacter sp. BA135]|uniref:M23 family metallopeptidase n=1 Tax=Aminobacter sp. BA135 TaxID=537596 RepID=UPI003D7BAB34
MQDTDQTIAELGNEPPLIADGRAGPPDRREVSARWLSGTFLTGVTSSVLMGVALFAALDGREKLATPPEIAELATLAAGGDAGQRAKTTRLAPLRQIAKAKDRRRMEVSMLTKEGDREVIRTMPFVQIKMALAASHPTTRSYPAFDPLTVFAEDGPAQQPAQAAATGQIYGVKVESEMSLKTVDFPIETATFDESSALSANEVEKVVRDAGGDLTEGDIQVASLHYVDPQRFGNAFADQTLAGSYGIKIVPENVSVSARADVDPETLSYAEDIIAFEKDRKIADALADAGYSGEDAQGMANAVSRLLNATALKAGTVLRVGLEVRGDVGKIVRTSVYDRSQHILTIALDDRNQFVPGDEPEPNPEIATAFEDTPTVPTTSRGALPTVYDGIYRAAYSYGMSQDMTKKLVRLLSSDVDFQSRLNPSDRIEVFFSQPDGDDKASADSELLYVSANFGGNTRNFYRFQMGDGAVDYFDEDGRSARQFLLRNPLPNGKFRSGFGGRKHPILGYVKMHTGVDWAAPTGTPIIASGNGVVEKAGWAGGYGKQTMIRHTNGYETSYNHQSRIAPGVVPGARVRQGQVIGYVGTTGLSTGAHLHYELIVNGTKVDPMRVRLPTGRVLKGEELVAFKRERERIDDLLKDENKDALKVASTAKVSG